MKNLINTIKKTLHIHDYVPLVSMYSGFETRKHIYVCTKCNHRKVVEEYNNYYSNKYFCIPTTNFITYKEFYEILNGAPLSNYPHLRFSFTKDQYEILSSNKLINGVNYYIEER